MRKERKMSQGDLAKMLHTSVSVVGRYERDEMKPSIEVAQKIAGFLETTVGYLLGENEDAELFKDPDMLKRFKQLNNLSSQDKDYILYTIDNLLQNFRTKQAYAS